VPAKLSTDSKPGADAAGTQTGDVAMFRHLAILVAAAALSGCATDYAYRGGAGDYYYGRPSVEYYDYGYGAPYGSIYGYPGGWYGGIGYGYGAGRYGYGYPYGYYGGYSAYPYWWYYTPRRPHRPHQPHRPPQGEHPPRVTGGNLPPSRVIGNQAPRSPAQVRPRGGAQPMRPPRPQGPWRDRVDARPPAVSRPAPRVQRPATSSRPAPGSRPAPRVSRPAPPPARPISREREPRRERERWHACVRRKVDAS